MIKKAIILAGGTGTRLKPITLTTNKQLLPIYDKPLIYYPLSSLMLAGIRNILIIVNKGLVQSFKKMLSDGSHLGIKISYKEQSKPTGIPDAFTIGKKFIKSDNIALILGDNFFFGTGFTGLLEKAKSMESGCYIFLKDVKNPKNYGVAVIKNKKIFKILEKPKKFISEKAITGLYFFDNNVIKYTQNLKPSKRNEKEIVDIINLYKKNKKLNYLDMGRGSLWSDVGKIEDFYNVSNYVALVEKIQGNKIACLEEIALNKGWIFKKDVQKRIKFLGPNPYSDYLKKVVN